MPIAHIIKSSEIKRSARVIQLEGLFDVPPGTKSEISWQVNLPIEDFDWNVGLIVGASGSGKSTIARHLFADHIVSGFDWDSDRSIVDGFPTGMGVKEITALLSSVGFSSPPNWLRPFNVLSNGEQFRVTMARALAEFPDLSVIDEFTSVVDRTVAQVGSAAIAKAVRQRNQKFIAVTCHYDVIEWLQPDWVYQPSANNFARGCLQRPSIQLSIKRVHYSAWQLFRRYHYLNTDLNKAAHCYVAFYKGQPVAFVGVLSFPHPKSPGWREHRLVCLPDFQGVGIGKVLSDFVASMYAATRKPFTSATGSPGLIQSRARSKNWNMLRKPGLTGKAGSSSSVKTAHATDRLTCAFKYVGTPRIEEAKNFGII
jgi:ABC-type molybdenum transport system ATPase subunit/photorepair protein PhrA/GNAT superfamily N-acetyltransferase